MDASRVVAMWAGVRAGRLVLVLLPVLVAVAAVPVLAGAAGPGDLLWGRTLSASVYRDTYHAAAAAPDGGIYVVGTTDTGDTVRAGMLLVRYDADGDLAWSHSFFGGAGQHAYGADVAVDGAGAVVATGTTFTSGSGDLMTVKYDAAGVFKWQTITSITAGGDESRAIDVDGSGNVYVAARGGGATTAIVLVKYASATGTELWRRSLYGPSDWAYPWDLAVDADGYAYVAGEATLPDTTSEFLVARWTPAGDRIWTSVFDGGHDGDDALFHVVLTRSSVYVAGRVGASPSRDACLVARYTRAGTPVWRRVFCYSRHGSCWTNSIAVDGRGRLTAAGAYDVPLPVDCTGFVTRLSLKGRRLWTARYHDARHRRGVSWGTVVCNGRGRVWCAGVVDRTTTNVDWIVAGYASDGRRRWTRTWGAADKLCDGDNAACLGGGGSFYVAGTAGTLATGDDLVVRKYAR